MKAMPELSHFGIFVCDVERMAAFYRDVLGFVETDRGALGDKQLIFLSGDPREHHQLVFVSGLSKLPVEEVVNQISFRLPTLEDLLRFHQTVLDHHAEDIRPINHGNAWSIYFRDPEGNRIEVTVDTPWYVSQPNRDPLNAALSADQIRAETEAWCRSQPSFEPAEEFRARVAAKISKAH